MHSVFACNINESAKALSTVSGMEETDHWSEVRASKPCTKLKNMLVYGHMDSKMKTWGKQFD